MPIASRSDHLSYGRFRLCAVGVATVGVLLTGVALAGSAGAVTAPTLGTAAPYSVLGGQSVTNTGVTTLSGDLGVDPGTATTGFPPGIVGGQTHAADAAALQAQSDLTIAYNSTAAEAPDHSVSGDLVGQTDTAGVYNSSGPLALSGTLTLDGQGDPNSVFVFQIASTLTTASASYINLTNGAQACNVFWQIGSSATLGTDSVFRGTIMALTSITVTTGAVVQGRALARNGSVTLDSDTFTPAACGTNTTTTTTATTTTVSATPNPATTGATTTVTAAVTGGTPTGTVTFFRNGIPLGTAPVDNTGHAALSTPAGAGTLTAHYNGDITTTPSTSTALTLTVQAVPAAAPATTQTPATPSTPVATILADTGTSHIPSLTATGCLLLTFGVGLTFIASARRGRGRHRTHRT
jgi:hypothetical protein